MNLTIKVFAVSGGSNTKTWYIARGYSVAGQLMISSSSYPDSIRGVNEIAEWCLANRPDWSVSL